MSKSELIAHKDFQVDDALLQSFQRVELDEATLLGTPLFCGVALDMAWDARCEDLARAVNRLKTISSQDALTLYNTIQYTIVLLKKLSGRSLTRNKLHVVVTSDQ